MRTHRAAHPPFTTTWLHLAILTSILLLPASLGCAGNPRALDAGSSSTVGETSTDASIWAEYYARTDDRPPRPVLVEALELFAKEGSSAERAVDAGCGSGVDTLYMLSQGLRVRAFDSTPEGIELLMSRVPEAAREALQAEVATFREADWGLDNDLVFAGYALPFARPEHFAQVWSQLVGSLGPGGRFVGHLFGDRDDWAEIEGRSHHTRAEVDELLAGFEVEVLREIENDRPTASGETKHWHLFEIIARKRR